MADETRSQDVRRMEDSIKRNAEQIEFHTGILQGLQNSIDGLTQLITTLNSKYDVLAEKVSSPSTFPAQPPPLLQNPYLNQRGFQPKLEFPKFLVKILSLGFINVKNSSN